MDNLLLILGSILVLIGSIGIISFYLKKTGSSEDTNTEGPREQQPVLPRRAVAARNQRLRLRPTAANQRQNVSEDENEDPDEPERNIELPEGKIGAKKRAKLEAKADKKAQREAEEREREERKKREAQKEEEREKREERERKEEAAKAEEEKKLREEKERKEREEYELLKGAFSIEEEGFEEAGEDDEANLLNSFLNFIKDTKVVVLEDLAAHFKMKTQAVIDRIQQLQAEGLLTGVIDDRGKFIYISPDELEAVAKFVRQRGRVSIIELAENSNKLISLLPSKTALAVGKS